MQSLIIDFIIYNVKIKKKESGDTMEKSKKILKALIIICLLAIIVILIVASYITEIKNKELFLKDATETISNLASKDEYTKEDIVLCNSIYNDFQDNEIIYNLYYFCLAKNMYSSFLENRSNSDLQSCKSYLRKIDDYSGILSEEIASFCKKVDSTKYIGSNANVKTNTSSGGSSKKGYNSLTSKDKTAIKEYIESRYDYYDKKEGGYSGDKYSDIIWQEVMNKYGLTENQVTIIWSGIG